VIGTPELLHSKDGGGRSCGTYPKIRGARYLTVNDVICPHVPRWGLSLLANSFAFLDGVHGINLASLPGNAGLGRRATKTHLRLRGCSASGPLRATKRENPEPRIVKFLRKEGPGGS
jgi:hypothetical protein